YDYWQFWRNTDDADVGTMLRRFTLLPITEIEKLEQLEGGEINEAKKILATETTALLHGRKAAEAAAETARQTFEAGTAAGMDLPTLSRTPADFEAGAALFPLFHELGLITSNGEGRRHIKGNALKVNGVPLSEERHLTADDVQDGVVKLSIGKKKHGLIKVSL
ncbi:MAG: tyrosine--tRNA ligase, partial [Pseudomonadota bacterium]